MATIGKSIIIKGELSGDEDLMIEGQVEGKITLPNHQLTVGSHGCVTAEVEAKDVVVTGRIIGTVTATERFEVQASGSIEGDVSAPRVSVEEGATFNGRIEMTRAATQKSTAPAEKPTLAPAGEPARKAG